jgi:hypothetical protein
LSDPPILIEIDALEAQGRLFEAIDVLRNAGATDNMELAKRLLCVRQAAFEQFSRNAVTCSWPPQIGDPFPDIHGVPEIRSDQLTVESVGGAIVHHGSVIVRELVSQEGAARLVDGIERSFDAIDAWSAGNATQETARWFQPFETGRRQKTAMRGWVRAGGGVWAVESPLVAGRVLDLYHSVGLRQILHDFFDDSPAISLEKLTLRKVGTDTIPSWHQDGSFLGEDIRSVNVWLALTDCGGDARVPGLDIVPRRVGDLLETGTFDAVLPDAIGHELVLRVAGDTGIVRPVFRAGDALLFDDRLVHRSAVSEGMSGYRYAVESWFFSASGFPAEYEGLAF